MVEHGQGAMKLDPALFCGDIDIRIAADGTWFHEGGPIGRKNLVKLFASVLERDEAGEYWLAGLGPLIQRTGPRVYVQGLYIYILAYVGLARSVADPTLLVSGRA